MEGTKLTIVHLPRGILGVVIYLAYLLLSPTSIEGLARRLTGKTFLVKLIEICSTTLMKFFGV